MCTADYPLSDTKKEKFCQLIARGRGLSEAFSEVWPDRRYKNKQCLYNAASILASRPAISARLASIRETIQTADVLQARELAAGLSGLFRSAVAAGDIDGACKTASQLSRLLGYDSPKRVEVAAAVGVGVGVSTNAARLSDSALLGLLGLAGQAVAAGGAARPAPAQVVDAGEADA